MLAATAIQDMTLAERLEAIELLWNSLASSPEQVPSPAWHERVLEERLKKVEAGDGKFLTLQELKDRLTQKPG